MPSQPPPPPTPLKRSSEDGPADDFYANKLPKIEHATPLNASVPTTPVNPHATLLAKRKAGPPSSRTGQACDRCKTRKIRCDDTQGGCLPCRQNNTECTTTDRITQRATVRGHTEAVEQDNNALRHELYELQQQLRDNGIEPKQPTPYVPARDSYTSQWSQQPTAYGQQWSGQNSGPSSAKIEGAERVYKSPSQPNVFALPAFRAGCHGDNYLGVSSRNSLVSPVKGTSLSVFGMDVDLADFSTEDQEENHSPTSYTKLLSSLSHGSPSFEPPPKAQLPPTYTECIEFASTYLAVLNPWLPVLHQPALLQLVEQFYRPGFQPRVADIVIIQMVLANVKFQTVSRNSDGSEYFKDLREQSFAHYHFALQHFFLLQSSRTLEDMQALTLFCIHLRSFPTPGPCWMVTSWVLTIATEMGLHRSTKAWVDSTNSTIEVEIRKRIFWTLLLIHVTVGSKLGRPMMLRREDFDVELPELLDESVQSESQKPSAQRCSLWASIELFKLLELVLDTYNLIYTIRPLPDYEGTIERQENRAQKWLDELPPVLKLGTPENDNPQNAVYALWMLFWEAEYQLVLHHPSLCRSSSPDFTAGNLQKCIQAAFKIISITGQLRARKMLDTTWINATTFIAAIFTLLYAYHIRKDSISSADVSRLRSDLDICLDIMGDVGQLLGSGSRLQMKIRTIIDQGLNPINRYLAEKTASAAVANANIKQAPTEFPSSQGYTRQTNGGRTSSIRPAEGVYTESRQTESEYQPAGQGSYSEPPPSATNSYSYSSYGPGTPNFGTNQASINNHQNVQQNPSGYVYNAQIGGPFATPVGPIPSWQQFTETLKGNQVDQPSDYMHATSALMTLGGGRGSDMQSPANGPGNAMAATGPSDITSTGMFPNLQNTIGLNGSVAPQPWPVAAGFGPHDVVGNTNATGNGGPAP